jgi:hypothetical protein
MLKFRSAPWTKNRYPAVPGKTQLGVPTPGAGFPVRMDGSGAPLVRRRLSRESGRALEILGHAIEYLADEYAADGEHKGPLGSADPRVEAIQALKALNRAVYYSGTEVSPASSRLRRWFGGLGVAG